METPPRAFQAWSLEDGRFEPAAADAPMVVGSLQKPFVVQAWAEAHPQATPPRIICPPGACWDRRGHGELGLVRAVALSCNAYFRALAEATPSAQLAATFHAAGFLGAPASPEAAIGRLVDGNPPRIRPSDLLRGYRRLVRTPWPAAEEVHRQLLAGLREAARTGTAGGFAVLPCWAKTGTVPLDDLHTAGLALVVDDAGRAWLGRLEPGTGREAAARLAGLVESGAMAAAGLADPAGLVTVRVLELLRGRRLLLRNCGMAPVPGPAGFLGPGARIALQPGEGAGPGLLELQEPRSGLVRRFRGRILRQRTGGRGVLLVTSRRDYVAGVIAAELADSADPRRTALGAAVLRFLAVGPRHPDADVCDATHCAWFVGLGPALRWDSPADARPADGPLLEPRIEDREWEDMLALARQPGPSRWTSHCGGRPLSERFLWGEGSGEAPPCPRHHGGSARPWARTWRLADLERIFDGPVEKMAVGEERGRWVLRVEGPGGARSFSYDEAHRRLARVLGWGALPSPADAVQRNADGFQARGGGLGHRVGLCLGE